MTIVLLRSAEKMPEESYAFKPTDSVRSFAQILGHIADSQYMFCSGVLGEKRPELKIEQTKTSKAELIGALKDALAYCDKAYEGLTDASAAEMVKLMGRDSPKLGALTTNSVHSVEHPAISSPIFDEEHRSSDERAGVHETDEEVSRGETKERDSRLTHEAAFHLARPTP